MPQLIRLFDWAEGKGVVSKTGLPEAAVTLAEETQAPVSSFCRAGRRITVKFDKTSKLAEKTHRLRYQVRRQAGGLRVHSRVSARDWAREALQVTVLRSGS